MRCFKSKQQIVLDRIISWERKVKVLVLKTDWQTYEDEIECIFRAIDRMWVIYKKYNKSNKED